MRKIMKRLELFYLSNNFAEVTFFCIEIHLPWPTVSKHTMTSLTHEKEKPISAQPRSPRVLYLFASTKVRCCHLEKVCSIREASKNLPDMVSEI